MKLCWWNFHFNGYAMNICHYAVKKSLALLFPVLVITTPVFSQSMNETFPESFDAALEYGVCLREGEFLIEKSGASQSLDTKQDRIDFIRRYCAESRELLIISSHQDFLPEGEYIADGLFKEVLEKF
ncbi:hypothetical protein [Roseibium marinum]|uniref:hypothetical protein n=1 Tax=Roseibium marinum TaxID=281252 RepID=UPI0011AF0014|nr:hypothetical protein [Roseibium marinum]